MNMHLPEIALKEPKTDPRTVVLHKRNFLESSSDHMPENFKPKMYNQKRSKSARVTAKCDRVKTRLHAECRQTIDLTAAAVVCLETATSSTFSLSEAATARITSPANSKADFAQATCTATTHSINLVNFNVSCHLQKYISLHRINDSLNNLYKFQKTKFLFVLLFICCVISSPTYLPTTQAIPVRRTTASGPRLILHSNVYRERYHQNLLQGQREHLQQQQQQQHLFQAQSRYQQKLHQQQLHMSRPAAYLAPILRRAHHHRQQQQQQQQHHLHQRAASTTTQNTIETQQKMSFCENNPIFKNLNRQINASLPVIKNHAEAFVQERENMTYEEMKDMWKLHSLEIRNPNHPPKKFENNIHQRMHDFYVNLTNFEKLFQYAHEDTITNKSKINQGEPKDMAAIILKFFDTIKPQIQYVLKETEDVLLKLSIEKPDVNEINVDYNKGVARKIRDFLIVEESMKELEAITKLLKLQCQNNVSNGK